jgi:hypothetical protein
LPRTSTFSSLLYTPNLQHLTLQDHGAPNTVIWLSYQFLDKWPQEQFMEYLGATSLHTLALKYLLLYETQVIKCLQRVSQLTELVLEVSAHCRSQQNVGNILLRPLTSWNVPPNGVPIASGRHPHLLWLLTPPSSSHQQG